MKRSTRRDHELVVCIAVVASSGPRTLARAPEEPSTSELEEEMKRALALVGGRLPAGSATVSDVLAQENEGWSRGIDAKGALHD